MKSKKPRNLLLTENFNLYDTMRLAEKPPNVLKIEKNSRKTSKSLLFSQTRCFTTDRNPSIAQETRETRETLENLSRFPAKIAKISRKSRETATLPAKTPLKLPHPFSKPSKTLENSEKTANFLQYLQQAQENQQKLRVFRNFKTNSMHLDLGDVKLKKSSVFYNVFSDYGQRNSLIADLSSRLYQNSKRLPGKPQEIAGFSRKISRFPKKIAEMQQSLDFLLKNSDFFEHKVLLADIIKAVKALQKLRNSLFCVKTLAQILGNCPILLKSLVNFQENQIFEPLTPRSLFLRLNETIFAGLKSPAKNLENPSNFSQTLKLEEHFVRLLVDFKARLQETAINLQNERFSRIKQQILQEYGEILDKELGLLQKNKGKNSKKYEKMKQDLRKRLEITTLAGSSTLSWSLRKCENFCGDLIYVDKLEKNALHEFENTVFAIKTQQNLLIDSIN